MLNQHSQKFGKLSSKSTKVAKSELNMFYISKNMLNQPFGKFGKLEIQHFESLKIPKVAKSELNMFHFAK